MTVLISKIKRYPQAAFWSIACSTFFTAALLGDSGLWGLLIYGSLAGGALVTAIADGRPGLRDYCARIVRWRVGLGWYAVALTLPLLLSLLAFGANLATGASLPENPRWPPWPEIGAAFFWPALFGIALAEEPGFRGFALHRLLGAHSALKAALIVGILHTLWHLPFLVQILLDGYYIGLLTKILIIVCASIFFTWLYNHTRGSVLIAMLLHASEDLFAGDGAPLTLAPLYSGFSATDLVRQDVFEALAFAATAVLLVAFTGNELGRKTSPRSD